MNERRWKFLLVTNTRHYRGMQATFCFLAVQIGIFTLWTWMKTSELESAPFRNDMSWLDERPHEFKLRKVADRRGHRWWDCVCELFHIHISFYFIFSLKTWRDGIEGDVGKLSCAEAAGPCLSICVWHVWHVWASGELVWVRVKWKSMPIGHQCARDGPDGYALAAYHAHRFPPTQMAKLCVCGGIHQTISHRSATNWFILYMCLYWDWE